MGYAASTNGKTVAPIEARVSANGKTYGVRSDLGDPLRYSAETQEAVFLCPYCEYLADKADTTGKLYYNEHKGMGHCFRCGTVVHDDAERTEIERVDREITLKEQERTEQIKIREQLKTQRYGLSFWTVDALTVEGAKSYLNQRGLSDAEIVKWNLRACISPDTGIVIPNQTYPKDQTDFFQVRRLGIAPDDKLKYRNPKNAEKPIFNLQRVTAIRTHVIVAEGVFSAMAAERVGLQYKDIINRHVVAVATYGKSIKKIHQTLFQEVAENIEEFYICYDGGEWNSTIGAAKSLSTLGKAVNIILLPFGSDPEDVGDDLLMYCLRNTTFRYTASMMKYLASKNPAKPDTERGWEKLRAIIAEQNRLIEQLENLP